MWERQRAQLLRCFADMILGIKISSSKSDRWFDSVLTNLLLKKQIIMRPKTQPQRFLIP